MNHDKKHKNANNIKKPVFIKISNDEKIIKFITHELACLRASEGNGSDRYEELTIAIDYLEKQDNIVKHYEDKLDKCACDNFNKGYKKALEKQGEHKETNLVEILKHYPRETELYSPLYGKLWLAKVDEKHEIITCYKHRLDEGCTRAILEQEDTVSFYSNGTTGLPDFDVSKDCMLFLYDIESQGEQKTIEWSKRQVVDVLTSMLTEKIKPIIKKSLDETINDREEMFMSALVEIRSFVNSPSFQVGKDVSAEWSEEDEKFLNYAISLTDDAQIKNFLKSLKYRATSHPKQEEKESDDKVEPKLNVDDWITFYGSEPFKILKVESEQNGILDYLLLEPSGRSTYYNKKYVDENARLWTIQDAKDGDILASNGNIILFKEISNSARNDYKYIKSHCLVLAHSTDFYTGGSYNLDDRFHPATKEQRDLLFQGMKEAGYKWDSEKKELKRIEQKFAWSEEDERTYNEIIDFFLGDYETRCVTIDKQRSFGYWLKSLKEKTLLQIK